MKALFLVGLGGGLGSICRYLVGLGIHKIHVGVFPFGTFAANITGCFLIGIFYGLAARQSWFTADFRLLFITGLCGGYTTFSSFSMESISMLRAGNYFYLILYVGLSIILGLVVTLMGYLLFK